jgi:hypothetical protein
MNGSALQPNDVDFRQTKPSRRGRQDVRHGAAARGRYSGAAVRPGADGEDDDQLTAERIVEVFRSDLVSRSVDVTAPTSPLSDQAWLNREHSTYYSPIELAQ